MEPQQDPPARESDIDINELSNVPPGRGRRPRSQTERPCDLCRRRKVGCCIRIPGAPCQLCKTLQKECTFITKPERRPRKRVHIEDATVQLTSRPPSHDSLRIGAVMNEVRGPTTVNDHSKSLQSTTSSISFEDNPGALGDGATDQFYPELQMDFNWMTPLSPWKQRKITCYPFASGFSDQNHTAVASLQPSSEDHFAIDPNRNESVEVGLVSRPTFLPTIGAHVSAALEPFSKSPDIGLRQSGQPLSREIASLGRIGREKCARYVGPSAAVDPYLLAACQDESHCRPFCKLLKDNYGKHVASFWVSDQETARLLENNISNSQSSEDILFSIVPRSQLLAYITL